MKPLPFTTHTANRWLVEEKLQQRTRRTIEQNARMWAMLHDIADQGTLTNNKLKFIPDEWKVIFLYELHKEIKLLPSLDGFGVVPYGAQASSNLTIKQMSAMIDLMNKWGAENGIKFRDQQEI